MPRSLLLLLLLAVPLSADEFQCGTSAEVRQQVRELGQWSAQRAERMAKTAQPLEVRDGIYVVPADDANMPFRRPVDLAGRTVVFTRNGSDSYSARTTALAYDENRGTTTSGTYAIKGFSFPFFGRNVTQLHLSRYNAIYLATPPAAADADQFSDLELASTRDAVIAPLLTTPDNQGTIPPAIYVRESADAVTVTWVDANRYDVQAVLAKSGEIRFSYKRADIRAASVLITAGDEAWRTRRTAIGTINDPSNDTNSSIPASVAPAMDIESVAASRIAESNLLEFRVKLREALTANRIPSGGRVTVAVTIRGSSGAAVGSLRFTLNSDGTRSYAVPAWGAVPNSPSAWVDGSTVVLQVLQDLLPSLSSTIDFAASTSLGNSVGDGTSRTNAPLPAAQRQVRTDFSSLETSRTFQGPIGEAFTLGTLSPARVWDQLQDQYGLRDDDIDGVAIYQNFFTNIVYYASAYSTVGNSGARGYFDDPGIGPNVPREPALMHLNKVGFGPNRNLRASEHVSLHEFGHRWLLFLTFMENGQRSTNLNPTGAHPAQWVDTRAAFPVYNPYDASPMGGGTFTENSDGTFTASPYGFYAYSWLDLYLMGLAAPEEVPPFFYIANSNPALGNAYYAPDNITVTGTRRTVAIQQVIDSMGPRLPAYPNTQRTFKVAFVLLADPDVAVDPGDLALVNEYRAEMEKGFRIGTGGRGELVTTLSTPPPPVRRRSVR